MGPAPPGKGLTRETLPAALFWLDTGPRGRADAALWWLSEPAATDTHHEPPQLPLEAREVIDVVFAEGEGRRAARGG